MSSKYENVQYFLALSTLYFTLTDKHKLDSDEDLIDFIDAINECSPSLFQEQSAL